MLEAREDDPPRAAPREGFILFGEKTLNWLQNGGVDTLESYGMEDYSGWVDSIPADHWEFLEKTTISSIRYPATISFTPDCCRPTRIGK